MLINTFKRVFADQKVMMATAAAADDLRGVRPDVLAERLRAEDTDTRAAALQALDTLPSPCPPELARAAVAPLVDLAAATEDRAVLDQCGLLVARLLAEAAPDPSALYGAAFGGERFAAFFAPRLLVQATQRALGNGSGEERRRPLAREDAYSFSCILAWMLPAHVRGLTAPAAAAGRTVMESLRTVRALFRHSSSASFCSLSPRFLLIRMARCRLTHVVLCRRSGCSG